MEFNTESVITQIHCFERMAYNALHKGKIKQAQQAESWIFGAKAVLMRGGAEEAHREAVQARDRVWNAITKTVEGINQ